MVSAHDYSHVQWLPCAQPSTRGQSKTRGGKALVWQARHHTACSNTFSSVQASRETRQHQTSQVKQVP